MRISNHWTIILALFPIIGTAQIVTTYDSRTNGAAIGSNYPARDIGVIDNLDTFGWMRSWSAPAMIDTETRIGVTITGTVAQAEADLQIAISNALPAIARERGKDLKAEVKSQKENAANQNSAPAQSAQIIRAFDLIEQMQEQIEILKSTPNRQE
jgi:hypothetical protein